jgi:hypothetical protein
MGIGMVQICADPLLMNEMAHLQFHRQYASGRHDAPAKDLLLEGDRHYCDRNAGGLGDCIAQPGNANANNYPRTRVSLCFL